MNANHNAADVATWRERIGAGTDFPLHAPTDVERAMVAEIAELRDRLQHQGCAKKVGPWIVIEGQRIKTQNLVEQQLNAERYQWLRDKADKIVGAPMVASLDASGHMIDLLDGEDLDAAVDTAMARRSSSKLRKPHRITVTSHDISLQGYRP